MSYKLLTVLSLTLLFSTSICNAQSDYDDSYEAYEVANPIPEVTIEDLNRETYDYLESPDVDPSIDISIMNRMIEENNSPAALDYLDQINQGSITDY